jgi:hypothetical protein
MADMRLSAHESELAAYLLWKEFVSQGYEVTVFLDGQKIGHPITADTDDGWIDAYMPNANGDPFINRNEMCPHRVTLRGDVQIMITNQ